MNSATNHLSNSSILHREHARPGRVWFTRAPDNDASAERYIASAFRAVFGTMLAVIVLICVLLAVHEGAPVDTGAVPDASYAQPII